jgi:hypothetical protein
LSKAIFCRKRYFGVANIFSSLIFCRQRYFVESYTKFIPWNQFLTYF